MDLIDRDIDTEELDLMVEDQRCIGRAQARLAARMVAFADLRKREGERCLDPRVGNLESSYVADEIGAALNLSTKRVRDMIGQARRVRLSMPNVWAAWRAGDIGQFTVWKIDTAALRLVRPESVTVLDEQVVDYSTSHTAGQLQSWLNRFVARTEAGEFAQRHTRVFKDRYVSIGHDPDAIAWINAMTSSMDGTHIDALLTKLARSLGANDPRTMDQRRADIFTDLLCGRQILDGGELRPGTGPGVTIGVVVPVDSLLGIDDAPGELMHRTTSIPPAIVRELATQKGTLFYRLLTDPLGNLLDVTELGRFPSKHLKFALTIRDGQCSFPTFPTSTSCREVPPSGQNVRRIRCHQSQQRLPLATTRTHLSGRRRATPHRPTIGQTRRAQRQPQWL